MYDFAGFSEGNRLTQQAVRRAFGFLLLMGKVSNYTSMCWEDRWSREKFSNMIFPPTDRRYIWSCWIKKTFYLTLGRDVAFEQGISESSIQKHGSFFVRPFMQWKPLPHLGVQASGGHRSSMVHSEKNLHKEAINYVRDFNTSMEYQMARNLSGCRNWNGSSETAKWNQKRKGDSW